MPVGPSTAQIGVAIWFALSIFVQLVTTFVLIGWLERRDRKLEWSMRAVPGYTELIYYQWCRAQGRAAAPVLLLRGLSLANLVLAVWAFFRVFVR